MTLEIAKLTAIPGDERLSPQEAQGNAAGRRPMPARSPSCGANTRAILKGVDIAVTGIPFDQAT